MAAAFRIRDEAAFLEEVGISLALLGELATGAPLGNDRGRDPPLD